MQRFIACVLDKRALQTGSPMSNKHGEKRVRKRLLTAVSFRLP